MTSKQIEKAKELRAQGLSYQKIADRLGVAFDTAYRWLNPEYKRRRVQRKKEWELAHKEHLRQYYKQYRQIHREERRQYQREYQKYHGRRYYLAHKEEKKRYVKQYRQTHKAELNAWDAKRRALKQEALANLTKGQKAEIKEIYRRAREDRNVRCYICGKKIPLGHRHVDHIVPLSKGGKHVPSNLAITCDECNLKKGAKTPEEIGMLV